MSLRVFTFFWSGCFLCSLLLTELHAQDANIPSVTGNGLHIVELEPTELRMSLQLTEKAPSLKEALTKLKTRSQAAHLQLEKLGAVKTEIKTTDPLLAEPNEQELQMMRAMSRSSARGGVVPKGLQKPKKVTVSSTLSAQWKITSQNREELLQFFDDLKTKLEAADLAGLKEPKQLSPEEQELEEEQSEDSFNNYSSRAATVPGRPDFLFAAKLSAEQYAQAQKVAFENAKAKASQLATAAGATIQELLSVRGSQATAPDWESYSPASFYGRSRTRFPGVENSELESISPTPEKILFRIPVYAMFRIR